MRLTLLFLFIFLGMEVSNAQFVNKNDLRNDANEYIKVWTWPIFMARGHHLQVDYGQEVARKRNSKLFLKDENGKRIKFYSSVQILNYFNELGFAYEDNCYPVSDQECYLLKRDHDTEKDQIENSYLN